MQAGLEKDFGDRSPETRGPVTVVAEAAGPGPGTRASWALRVVRLAAIVVAGLGVGAAHGSDFGCTVLLCLANPAANGGPHAIAACRAPLARLYRDLARGRGFPGCALASSAGSYAQRVFDPFDPCPEGTVVAPPEVLIAPGMRVGPGAAAVRITASPRRVPATVTGDAPQPRACVGAPLGAVWQRDGDTTEQIQAYDRVVWQTPQNPRAIDIYLDGHWQQRVRW